MRRLAISILTLMAGLTLFGPAVQAQTDSDTPDRQPADRRFCAGADRCPPGERLHGSDPGRGDRPGHRPRAAGGLAGAHPAGQQRRHRRVRRCRGRAAGAGGERTDPDRDLGRTEWRPFLRHRRATARRCRRDRDGARCPGRLHRGPAGPRRPARRGQRRLRRRRGTPSQRIRRAVRHALAERLQATHRRRRCPDDQQHGAGDGRLRGERRRARHERARRARRRVDPLRHGLGRPVLEVVPGRSAVPHRGQPTGCLPAVAHGPGTARVRVLHGRRRVGRRRRCHLYGARLQWPRRPADPAVGGGADHAGHAGVRRRRPSRHSTVLDRCRDRADDRRELVPVRTDPRLVDATVVARPGRGDRRHHPHVHRRDAIDGADPLLHTHDRPGVDDRPAGCCDRARGSRRDRRGRRCTMEGPHEPGDADSRWATRCEWRRSTASPSTSNPWKAPPATTARCARRPTHLPLRRQPRRRTLPRPTPAPEAHRSSGQTRAGDAHVVATAGDTPGIELGHQR